jgi:hypothetical protein
MPTSPSLNLDDLITAVYCALDDALIEAKIECHEGKLIPRRGPPPAMDDREVLCLAVLEELLGFESDNAFFLWMENNAVVRATFPRLLSRQKFADRRVLLTPLIQKLSGAFCALGGEEHPPFVSSTPIRSTSANWCAANSANDSADWLQLATAPH